MLKKTLKNLPKAAGIYQFFNDSNKIIYIGKSVNLFSRVNSYFNGKSKLNFAKQKMVEQISDIKTILVNNETESLILETNLIKEHLPKYNILMKDGKNHLYIKITSGDFPKIIKTRVKRQTQGTRSTKNSRAEPCVHPRTEYFGPYLSSHDLDNILAVLKKVYGYGIGEHNFFKNKNNYNLDKYLFNGNIQDITENTKKQLYNKKIDEIKYFLKGNYSTVISELREKMLGHAQNHEFERADIIKSQISSIETLNEKQIVREGILGDYDIVHYLEKFDKIFIGKIEIRDSRILGFYPYEIKNELGEEVKTLLENFVKNNYLKSIIKDLESKKPVLLISKKIHLEEDIFSGIKIEYPKIGTKVDLLKMCYKNIYEFAYKKHLASLSTKAFTKQNMKNLLHVLGYKRINKKILFECNDISHLSGTHTVASRSVIENGKTANSQYKKFRIKNLEVGKIDDFNSMREIMERRLKEIEHTGVIPDLIIIDGGKGQLSSVVEIIDEYLKFPHPPSGTSPLQEEDNKLNNNNNNRELISKLQLVGLAKREEELFIINPHPPSGTSPLQEEENRFKKIVLEKDSLELRLVQKIRDEAHRFAITFNRDSRIKSMKKNILESLPGFGPVARKKILKEFGSVEKLREVERKDLEKILNKNQIEILEDHGLV